MMKEDLIYILQLERQLKTNMLANSSHYVANHLALPKLAPYVHHLMSCEAKSRQWENHIKRLRDR